MYMCVYIYPVRNTETHWYQNISFQLPIWNGMRNEIENIGLLHTYFELKLWVEDTISTKLKAGFQLKKVSVTTFILSYLLTFHNFRISLSDIWVVWITIWWARPFFKIQKQSADLERNWIFRKDKWYKHWLKFKTSNGCFLLTKWTSARFGPHIFWKLAQYFLNRLKHWNKTTIFLAPHIIIHFLS